MPISRRQFDLGINEDIEAWMRRIDEFLAQHPSEAFSVAELARQFGVPELDMSVHTVAQNLSSFLMSDEQKRFAVALVKLSDVDVVSEREVAGDSYFASGRYRLTEILDDAAPGRAKNR
jgi:hypothetical protein